MNGDCDVINRLLNETMHMDFHFLQVKIRRKELLKIRRYI